MTKKYLICIVPFLTLLTACGSSGSAPAEVNTPPSPEDSQFVDVTSGSGISFTILSVRSQNELLELPRIAGGVAAGDYDQDGDIDLFVVRGDLLPNLLYRNVGNNVFEDVAEAAGLAWTNPTNLPVLENYYHSGPTFADIDGDGDLDLFLGGIFDDPALIFANNGDGTFTDVTADSGLEALDGIDNISAGFGDYDLDGDLDLFVSHWTTRHSPTLLRDTSNLWRNDSDADGIKFVSVTIEAGIAPSIVQLPDPNAEDRLGTDYTFAPTFARVDDDLFPDILSVADFNTSQVFMNDQDGTFTNVTDVDVIDDNNGMGSAVGDYDNDGDLDWFVSSIYGPNENPSATGNRLYRNDNGTFVNVTDETGVVDGGWGWGSCFVDLENDGDLDIYHTNGWEGQAYAGDFRQDTSRAFISDGDGHFEDQAFELGLADAEQGRGVVCADFDNDGDIDIFLWHQNEDNAGTFFRNDATGNNFLSVRLDGLAPNTEATGARIMAEVNGVTQMREIVIGSNFISQNPTTQIFGLGSASQVDSLRIEWPDGLTTDMGVQQAGQFLVIDHPNN